MRKLLFFHATWCPPCRFYEKQFIAPLEQIARSNKVRRIDTQSDPFTAERYQVDKLPAVVLLDGEKAYASLTGAIDVKALGEWLKET